METNTLSVFRHKQDVLFIVCKFDLEQFIVVTESNGSQTSFSHICEICDRCFLYQPLLCCHKQETAFLVLPDRDQRRDLLARQQLEQVDDRGTACRTARLRNLIALQTVHSSLIRKEHQIMVRARHQQFFYVVILQRLHSLDALATSVLALEVVRCHALDVAKLRHRDDHVLIRDQILGCQIKHVALDARAAVIAVLVADDLNFLFDHTKQQVLICKDCPILFDLFQQLLILCLNFLAFQTGQCTQSHVHDCLRLRIA